MTTEVIYSEFTHKLWVKLLDMPCPLRRVVKTGPRNIKKAKLRGKEESTTVGMSPLSATNIAGKIEFPNS